MKARQITIGRLTITVGPGEWFCPLPERLRHSLTFIRAYYDRPGTMSVWLPFPRRTVYLQVWWTP